MAEIIDVSGMMDIEYLRKLLASSHQNTSQPMQARLSSDFEKTRDVLVQFARYLAGYYIGLPQFDQPRNLFTWTLMYDAAESDGGVDNDPEPGASDSYQRLQLASILPPEYTPRLVAELFFLAGHPLEAILFIDHFNAPRSQLVARLLGDTIMGLAGVNSLFEEHCRLILIEGLFEWLEGVVDAKSECSEEVEKILNERIIMHISSLLQLDAVFERGYQHELEQRVLASLEEYVAKLDDTVDEWVELPRPPMYVASSHSPHRQSNREIRLCDYIHYLLRVIFISLSRSNRLCYLSNWLLEKVLSRSGISLAAEVSNYATICYDTDIVLASPVESAPSKLDQKILQRLLMVILKLELRDRLSLMQRAASDSAADVQYRALTTCFSTLLSEDKEAASGAEDVIDRWLDCSSEADKNVAVTFLCYIQEKYPQRERYLPPFSDSTRAQWRNSFLLHNKPTSTSSPFSIEARDDGLKLPDEAKFPLHGELLTQLAFLHTLELPPLVGPDLIQIRLDFDPVELCRVGMKKRSDEETEEIEVSQQLRVNGAPAHTQARRPVPTGVKLLQEISDCIQRLGEFERSSQLVVEHNGLILIDDSSNGVPPIEDSYRYGQRQAPCQQHRSEPSKVPTAVEPMEEDFYASHVMGGEEKEHILHTRTLLSLEGEEVSSTSSTTSDLERSSTAMSDLSMREELRQIAKRLASIKTQLGMERTTSATPSSDGVEQGVGIEATHHYAYPVEGIGKDVPNGKISPHMQTERDLSVIEEQEETEGDYGVGLHEVAEIAGKSFDASLSDKEAAKAASSREATAMHLDLSQLESRQPTLELEKRKSTSEKTSAQKSKQYRWDELEVYPRRKTITGGVEAIPSNSPKLEQPKRLPLSYPTWLRLLPKSEGTSSSRLLKLPDLQDTKEKCTSARSVCTHYILGGEAPKSPTYDSGFVEQQMDAECPFLFVRELPQEQVDRLIKLATSSATTKC